MMRWSTDGCPFAVDMVQAVIAVARARAQEAFRSLPYGGMETGGVLFGRVYPNARTPLRLEIAAERAVECSYESGPSFQLSARDEGKLAGLLENARLDPALAGLSVVGFWVSHTRTELALLPGDSKLYNKFFPHPWQVALMLKPAGGELTRAGFFFRGLGPAAERCAREFYVETGLPVDVGAAAFIEAEPLGPILVGPILLEERNDDSAVLRNSLRSFDRMGKKPRKRSVKALLNALTMLVFFLSGAAATIWLRDFWTPWLAR